MEPGVAAYRSRYVVDRVRCRTQRAPCVVDALEHTRCQCSTVKADEQRLMTTLVCDVQEYVVQEASPVCCHDRILVQR